MKLIMNSKYLIKKSKICLNLSKYLVCYLNTFRLNEIIDVSCSIPEYYNLKADINGDFNFD